MTSAEKYLSSLLNMKSGIDSNGYDTFQVVGASTPDEAVKDLNSYKLNYDPNPIVIKKTDPRGAVQYKQKIFVRYLQPPPPPQPGPLIIQEKRPPQQKPLPPLIVRQRPPRPKTPQPLILREMPPGEVRNNGNPPNLRMAPDEPEVAALGLNLDSAAKSSSQYDGPNVNVDQPYYEPMQQINSNANVSRNFENGYYGNYEPLPADSYGYNYRASELYDPFKQDVAYNTYNDPNQSDILRHVLGNGAAANSMTSNGWTTEVIRN